MMQQNTVERFRTRLSEVIRRTGLSRSAFARRVGIDRSTLSQILSPANDRLPRLETLAAIATSEKISLDWLVGLSEEGPMAAAVLEVEPGGGSPSDERLARWRAEAAGYKIRYIPTTIPDMLRTDDLIEYEYSRSPVATPEQRRETREEQLSYERRPETDTEVCSPLQMLEALANGTHVWAKLPASTRKAQLVHMAKLTEELYPTFRWFLFDGLTRFSTPLTIIGNKRAIIYTGQVYLVFNGAEHIRVLTSQFDGLIRDAVIQPPDVPVYLHGLCKRI